MLVVLCPPHIHTQMVVHDVMLAMSGFDGDVVERDIDTGKMQLADSVQVETFDREIIEDLLHLASVHHRVFMWADSVIDGNGTLYEAAIATGLQDHVLEPYSDDLQVFFRRIYQLWPTMHGGGITLATLRLEMWQKWLPILEVVKVEIVDRASELSSGSINAIDKMIELSGILRNSFFDKIVANLVNSFVKELVSWGKYGVIAGGSGRSRFFVRSQPPTETEVRGIDEIAQYQIDTQLVPTRLVSPQVSAKILFCGRAVIVLRNGDRSALVTVGCDAFAPGTIPADFHDAVEYIEMEVEKLRLFLSKKLNEKLKLRMTPNLGSHLRRLRGILLMGSGDKWTAYLDDVGKRGIRQSDAVFESVFETEIEACSVAMHEGTIDYTLPWPVELVISPAALVKYNEVFSLLLKCVTVLFKLRGQFSPKVNSLFTNLVDYFQIDLIETEFARLTAITEASEDVQEIANAHELFLSAVHTGCLVGVHSVWDRLDVTIALSDKLTRDQITATAFEAEFKTEIMAIFQELEGLQMRSTYSSIGRLLLKLDYNRYYRNE